MSLVHDAVDDDDTDTTNTGSNTTYFDSVNNYTFTVSRQNGSTYLRPRYPPPNAVEIRVGVLLPYHQNFSAYTTELTLSGTSAVRLAAAQINTQNQMPGAYITLVEKDSFQDNNLNGQEAVTQAVVAALDLVVHKGVVGVIGDISSSWTSLSALITSTLKVPQCSFSSVATSLSDQTQHDYFFRTIQTPLLYADAGFSFVKSQGWHHVSILYSDDDYGNPLFQYTMLKAKANGIIVDHFAGFYSEADTFADTTAKVHNFYAAGPHIVLFAAQNDALNFAFIAAADAGYIDTDHAWVVLGPVDNSEMVQVVETFNNVLVQRKTDTNQPQLQQQPNMTDMDIMPLYPRAHISSALALKAARVAISPIEYLAWKSKRMQNIVYRQTFDGGIFSFAVTSNLSGYPPYETFRTTWAKLNSSLYPYAGQEVTLNDGLAYSCMMMMARGFQNVVHNSSNVAEALQKLASGRLGRQMTPPTFSTGYVGPNGKITLNQNGDRIQGNFDLYNHKDGEPQLIGTIFNGTLTLTAPPLYHGEVYRPPNDEFNSIPDASGYATVICISILTFLSFGALIALVSAVAVVVKRNHPVIKAASFASCLLEIAGFCLTYSTAFFFIVDRSRADCYIIPITLHLGIGTIMINIIAKLLTLHRINQNIYIQYRCYISDKTLIRTTAFAFTAIALLLATWLSVTTVDFATIPVTSGDYFIQCDYSGSGSVALNIFVTLVSASMIAFGMVLSLRTRSLRVVARESMFSEAKQLHLTTYNIFFASLIGFIVFNTPTSDYFTRHFLTAALIVWGSTVSLLLLFLPKLHALFKRSSGIVSHNCSKATNNSQDNAEDQYQQQSTLMSINRMIATNNISGLQTDSPIGTSRSPDGTAVETSSSLQLGQRYQSAPVYRRVRLSRNRINADNTEGEDEADSMEVHECRLPVQYIFRYFPYFARWDMKRIILLPHTRYFSFVSEKSHRGRVFPYTCATIANEEEGHVLKVHGSQCHDLLLQVENTEELHRWVAWFNER